MALMTLTIVSIVCVALLFIERRDTDLLLQRASSLREENAELRSQLDNYRSSLVTQQENTARSPD